MKTDKAVVWEGGCIGWRGAKGREISQKANGIEIVQIREGKGLEWENRNRPEEERTG